MALRDRGSIRKVATSGPKVRFGHRRPSGLDGGSPLACRLQACPAGEPWHQFVRSGCHAGSAVLSYGRTPLERAIGWLRCLVGSHGVRKMKVAEAARRPTKVGSRDRKVARAELTVEAEVKAKEEEVQVGATEATEEVREVCQ